MEDKFVRRISRVLQDLSAHTACGGIFYPIDDSSPPIAGRGVSRFCAACIAHPRAGAFCANNAGTCAVQGFTIGDAWYFRCWLGLDSIVVPIAPKGEILGSIEAGGFFSPGESEQAQQTVLSRLASLDSAGALKMFTSSLQAMQELDFKQVKAVADFLLEATFSQGLNDASMFVMRRKISEQQQRLAVKLEELQQQRSKPFGETLSSLSDLFSALRRNNRKRVMIALDTFLGQVLLNAGNDLARAKASVLVLLSMLTRECIDTGAQWHTVMTVLDQELVELDKCADIESLCFWVESQVMAHLEKAAAGPLQSAAESASDRVLAWMRGNFSRKIVLADAAEEVGASVSTIIHRLRKETGRTFSQHLTAVRVNEAKRLLAYTDLTLGEICSLCGFSDQSYFTKVFRRSINLTPRQFRQMLNQAR